MKTPPDNRPAKPAASPAKRAPARLLSRPLLLLGMILLLAAGVRLAFLGSKSLWLDELWTAELSTGRGSLHLTLPANQLIAHPPSPTSLDGAPPWYKVWTGLGDVTHPPLYFLALRLWRDVFGQGDIAMRSLSVVASLLAILLLYDIGRRLYGPGPALWACLLMALAQPQIEAAQEARNYAFLVMMGLAACDALLLVEQRGPTLARIALLALCILATVMVHYFAVGAMLGLFVYVLIRFQGSCRWRAVSAFAVAAVAFLLIWGPFMWAQRGRFSTVDQTTLFLLDQGSSHVLDTLASALQLPLRFLMSSAPDLLPATALAGAFYLLPILLLRRRPALLLPCLLAAGTIGLITAMDLFRSTTHLHYIRYTLLAAPPLYLLLSASLWSPRDTFLRHLLPAIAVVPCLLGLSYAYEDHNPNWPALAQYLDQRTAPGDLLVFAKPGLPDWTGYDFIGFAHYTRKRLPAIVLLHPPAPPGLFDNARRLWLINGSPEISPRQIMPGYIPRGEKIEGLKVSVWQMMRPQP